MNKKRWTPEEETYLMGKMGDTLRSGYFPKPGRTVDVIKIRTARLRIDHRKDVCHRCVTKI